MPRTKKPVQLYVLRILFIRKHLLLTPLERTLYKQGKPQKHAGTSVVAFLFRQKNRESNRVI